MKQHLYTDSILVNVAHESSLYYPCNQQGNSHKNNPDILIQTNLLDSNFYYLQHNWCILHFHYLLNIVKLSALPAITPQTAQRMVY